MCKTEGLFEQLTNLNEDQLTDLYRYSVKWILTNRKRGPLPAVSYADGWIVLLAFYKINTSQDTLARFLHIKPSTFSDTVARMRPIVNQTLKERWWENRKRPRPLNHPTYPYIALLVDHMSVQVYRPKGDFCEAKAYWDGKNNIYP